MKIEDQVCNLELSKRLKAFGVKQESYFNWIPTDTMLDGMFHPSSMKGWYIANVGDTEEMKKAENYAAFSVAELGAMLPYDFDYPNENKCYVRECFQESSKVHICWYRGSDWPMGRASTEADARGRMLLILLENGYIKSEELNTE